MCLLLNHPSQEEEMAAFCSIFYKGREFGHIKMRFCESFCAFVLHVPWALKRERERQRDREEEKNENPVSQMSLIYVVLYCSTLER
jgi:hypothetical protein